jgi:hypothetical protein
MRFYTSPHQFYPGIDSHARSMHVYVSSGRSAVMKRAVQIKSEGRPVPLVTT